MDLKKIGIIMSPYKEKGQAPKQGRLSDTILTIEVFPEYKDALLSLEKSSIINVLYWGDRADRSVLQTIPPHGTEIMGVFATRSPNRPNPIALCVCKIIDIEDNILKVQGLDALDKSPLLDIKICSKRLDNYEEVNGND